MNKNLVLLVLLISIGFAGPLAYGICQPGCCTLAVSCYAAARFTFGTVFAVAAPPAILGCNSALGSCMTACVAAGFAPTPQR